jgi:uncharacterized RDD family membrane protein YckC
MKPDNSLGDGVYYAMSDYAGFLRRVVVIAIDTTVLLVIGVCLWFPILTVWWAVIPERDPSGFFLLAWIVSAWLYLTVLKRSRVRTVAYRLLGLKIVTTKGERPSLLAMTFRMFMWMFGPFNFILDLIWLGADTEQQSLRDCYVGTYVVRYDAEPLGVGPMHLTRYNAAGFNLAYPRVCRPVECDSEEA